MINQRFILNLSLSATYKIFFLTLLSLSLSISCTKEDSRFKETASSDAQISISNSVVLPVNLSAYNLLSGTSTKSSNSTQSPFVFTFDQDSLITDAGIRQKYFEDSKWIYTEFPFKSELCPYASITPDKKSFADSLVSTKCFYMLVEHPTEPVDWTEYIVTMIPSKSYSLSNPDYTFLEMPSFSGIVLYSTIEGDFLRSENYNDGKITFTTLRKKDGITKSSPSIWDLGSLTTLYITASRPVGDMRIGFDISILEDLEKSAQLETIEAIDYTERKDDTGGGSGGGSRSSDKNVVVTEIHIPCSESAKITRTHMVVKGSSLTLNATAPADTVCHFTCWVSTSGINTFDKSITLTDIKRDVIAEAKYASPYFNSDCYRLYESLVKHNRWRFIEQLLDIFSDSLEYSAVSLLGHFGQDSSVIKKGQSGSSTIVYKVNHKYYGATHTHDHGNACFPSAADFGIMCYSFYKLGWSYYFFDIIARTVGKENHFDYMSLHVSDYLGFKTKVRSFIDPEVALDDLLSMYSLKVNAEKKFQQVFGDTIEYSGDTYEKLASFLNNYGIRYEMISIKVDTTRNFQNFSWHEFDSKYGTKYPRNYMKKINNCFIRVSKQ